MIKECPPIRDVWNSDWWSIIITIVIILSSSQSFLLSLFEGCTQTPHFSRKINHHYFNQGPENPPWAKSQQKFAEAFNLYFRSTKNMGDSSLKRALFENAGNGSIRSLFRECTVSKSDFFKFDGLTDWCLSVCLFFCKCLDLHIGQTFASNLVKLLFFCFKSAAMKWDSVGLLVGDTSLYTPVNQDSNGTHPYVDDTCLERWWFSMARSI